jgi:hypothetical protein
MTGQLINSTLIKNKGYLLHSVFSKLLKKYSRKAKNAAVQRNKTCEDCGEGGVGANFVSDVNGR